jgi:hypothetical protein
VDSVSGKGTTFTLYVPEIAAPAGTSGKTAAPALV